MDDDPGGQPRAVSVARKQEMYLTGRRWAQAVQLGRGLTGEQRAWPRGQDRAPQALVSSRLARVGQQDAAMEPSPSTRSDPMPDCVLGEEAESLLDCEHAFLAPHQVIPLID